MTHYGATPMCCLPANLFLGYLSLSCQKILVLKPDVSLVGIWNLHSWIQPLCGAYKFISNLPTPSILTGFPQLQMPHQLRSSSRSHDNVEPPSSHPPQPTSAELLKMIAESQRALVESCNSNVYQGLEPIQYNNYKDFLDTEPPIF
jgi:hypothetical protein